MDISDEERDDLSKLQEQMLEVIGSEMGRLEENLAGTCMQDFIKSYIDERVGILKGELFERIE